MSFSVSLYAVQALFYCILVLSNQTPWPFISCIQLNWKAIKIDIKAIAKKGSVVEINVYSSECIYNKTHFFCMLFSSWFELRTSLRPPLRSILKNSISKASFRYSKNYIFFFMLFNTSLGLLLQNNIIGKISLYFPVNFESYVGEDFSHKDF